MSIQETMPARLKASGIHFSASLLIFLALLGLIYYVWYPQALFWSDGGIQGVKILIGVDLVLGPLLTLLIYNPTKTRKHIIMDLSVIILIQLSAMAWGVHNIYSQRPVTLVADEGILHPMTQPIYSEQLVEYESLSSGSIPAVVYSRNPQNTDEQTGLISYSMIENIPKWQVGFLHEPAAKHMDAIRKMSVDVAQRFKNAPAVYDAYQQIRAQYGDELIYLRFEGRYGNSIIAVNESGEIVSSICLM